MYGMYIVCIYVSIYRLYFCCGSRDPQRLNLGTEGLFGLKRRVLFCWYPYDESFCISGSILGSPDFWERPCGVFRFPILES